MRDHSLDQIVEIQAQHPIEYLKGATGLFWDCAFGLFAANPAWLLLIPAVLVVVWQRRPIALDLLLLGVPYLAVVAPRVEWYGAWSPPFRFGVVFLPLLAMALVPLLANSARAGARVVTTVCVALGALLTLLWLAEPGWTYNLATGTNHLLDHLASLWSADAARLFPSIVRPRAASWVVPLLVGSVVIALWWWPQRKFGWLQTGVVLTLLALAAVPLAAQRLTTRLIEMEDRQVIKIGGELYPELWEPYRPRFRGGWRVMAGDSVRAPVVAGGEQVSITLELRFRHRHETPLVVSVSAGDEVLAERALVALRNWQILEFEHLDWIEDSPLVLNFEAPSSPATSAAGTVILDRVRLHWD